MKFLASLFLAAAIPYIESIEITVNNVDVIVTDRAGNRVHGLQKSDFELLENNVPQAISNFSEYQGAERVPVATTEPSPAPQTRKFVLLFDDLSLHPNSAAKLKRQIDAMVDATMQQGDAMMILTPISKTAKLALPFSPDKRAIHDAVESVMRQSVFRANSELVREQMSFQTNTRSLLPSSYSTRAYAESGVSRRVKRTLGHLQAIVTALAEVPGKKSVIFGAGIEPLFRQLAQDATDYYSLGYRAASEERDKARGIVVRVRNHPEYEVRSRRAVVRKSAPNEMRDLVIAQLVDDRPIDELNASSSAGKAQRELRGSLLLPVDIKVPLSKLTYLRDGDVYRASFRVHYAAESSTLFAPGEGREQVVEVPSADMPNIGGKYFTYTSSLRVMKGEVKVSVGVLDPLSHLATIKTMTVEAR